MFSNNERSIGAKIFLHYDRGYTTSNIKLFNPDITQSPVTLPLHEVKTEPEPEEKSENGYVTVLKWVTLQAQKINKKQITKN